MTQRLEHNGGAVGGHRVAQRQGCVVLAAWLPLRFACLLLVLGRRLHIRLLVPSRCCRLGPQRQALDGCRCLPHLQRWWRGSLWI